MLLGRRFCWFGTLRVCVRWRRGSPPNWDDGAGDVTKTPDGAWSGLADDAGEASDEQGGKTPGQQLQPPASSGKYLAGGTGSRVAVIPDPGLDQRQPEIQADADPLYR